MSKYCTKCGQALSDESLFCSACGTKQETTAFKKYTNEAKVEVAVTQTVQQKPKIEHKNFNFSQLPYSKPTIFKQFLLCLLSLILVIAIFLPYRTINFKYDKDKTTIGITPIDNIIFLFDSFSSLDSEDIQDSDLYESIVDDLEDFIEEFSDNDNEFNAKSRSLFSRIVKNATRLYFMSEEFDVTLLLVLEGIISIAYIIVSVLFLIFSVLKLLDQLNIISTKVYRESYHILDLILAIFVGLCTISKLDATQISSLNLEIEDIAVNSVAGSGMILSIIGFVITFAGMIAIRFIYEKNLTKFNPVKSIISAVCAIALILLCVAPTFNAKIKTYYEGDTYRKTATVEVYSDIYGNAVITEEEEEFLDNFEDANREEIKQYFESLLSEFKLYTSKEVKKGEANTLVHKIILYAYKTQTTKLEQTISSIIPLLILFTTMSAGYLLGLLALRFITNINKKNSISLAKMLILISMIAFFTLNTIFVITANANLHKYLSSAFNLALSSANIIALIVSIVLTIVNNDRDTFGALKFTEFYGKNISTITNFGANVDNITNN